MIEKIGAWKCKLLYFPAFPEKIRHFFSLFTNAKCAFFLSPSKKGLRFLSREEVPVKQRILLHYLTIPQFWDRCNCFIKFVQKVDSVFS